jgi:ribose transport system permease protein
MTSPAGSNASVHDEEEPTLTGLQRIGQSLREVVIRAYRGENSGALILVMLVVIAIFAVMLRETTYLSTTNFLGIVRQTAAITIMAVPTVFVISCGEIDLSIAAVVPVAAFIAALLLPGYGLVLSVLAALAFGALVGFINGVVTVRFRIPSFVVTLGTLSILQGIALRITGVISVAVKDKTFTDIFGNGTVGPISVQVLWTLGVAGLGFVILAWTPIGRAVLASGANVNAARFSGIRTDRVKIGALTASGMGGALAGLLYTGQYGAASYTLGTSDLLTVIAAVIIGGTALAGGKGSVLGAVVGSLLIGTLNNGLVIIGLANPEQLIARGIIIIAAVMFSARTVGQRKAGPRFDRLSLRRSSADIAAQPTPSGPSSASTLPDPQHDDGRKDPT